MLGKPRTWFILVAVLAGLFLTDQFWHWTIERTEVPPDHFLVRIHKWGHDLDEEQIIAPDEEHKGVMEEELKEGRYFLNPIFWTYEIHKAIIVPPDKYLVLTRKFGAPISPDRVARGEFLAEPGERGVVREVRLPGKHYINPHAYDTELQDAIKIGPNQVGVKTLLWGQDPRELKGLAGGQNIYVVPEGYRGVQDKVVPSGTHYPNPFVERIDAVDIGSHQVEFRDIEFPSPDGYTLNPHVLVTYHVLPEMAPQLFVTLSNAGQLHQGSATPEEQQQNEILQKVVLPLIRGYARIEGSKFKARDFIAQTGTARDPQAVNPLEKVQQELMDAVTPKCKEVGIAIESITLVEMRVEGELADLAKQIAQREQARLTRETNKKLIEQYKEQQALKAAEALKLQNEAKVKAQTALAVQKTKAEQLKEVEEARQKQDLKAAEVRLEAARDRAKAILSRGKADADVVTAQNQAEVSGLRTAVGGFPSADAYAQAQVLTRLAPALAEIFASDSSDFAKLFAAYLTPSKNMPAVPVGAGNSTPAPTQPSPKLGEGRVGGSAPKK